jgi:hypothetical protein
MCEQGLAQRSGPCRGLGEIEGRLHSTAPSTSAKLVSELSSLGKLRNGL